MDSRRIHTLAISVLLVAQVAWGQACSIDLGPDHTICQGNTVTLTAPAGYPNYLWSTGSTAPSITVGTAGNYWGRVSYPTGELATNGNFSGGNSGFSTPFIYNNVLTTEGNFWIGNNAASYHPQFFGTGNGPFLMVNAGWMHAGWEVWCNTITVCPNQTYTLRVRAMSLATSGAPLLDWAVDGVQQGLWMQTGAQGSWTTFTNTWTSGPAQTSANICLRVASGHGVGNDIGVDDISIQSTIVLQDDVNVNVTPLPSFDLGPNATLCAGQNLVLDAAVPGGTYLWQDGSTSPNYVVNSAGNYTVDVTANGCTATDAITVNYTPLPVVDIGPDLTLCSGQSTVLNASTPGGSYVWQDGSTAGTFTVNGPGNYTVQVTVNNCASSDAVDIAYNPTPVVDLGPDLTACAGTTLTLDATTPSATYLWSTGATTATLDVTTNGAYSVQVTVNGCTDTDAVNVSFTPLPVVNLGPDQTVCPGTVVNLNATVPGGSYLWQDGSTAATYAASTPGNYSVQVTRNGCSSTDAINVAHFTLQTVDLGPDITICAGQAVTIGVSVPGSTYLWNTGATSSSIGASTAGIFWQDVSLNGCVVRDSLEVSVTPLPVVDLGADLMICPGTTLTLDATTPAATYAWNTGATTATITAAPGDYDVTVTTNGCSNSDAISVGAWPAAVVDLGPDLVVCPGTPVLLDVSQPGASYVWQDASTGSSLLINTGGTYSVQLTDANGCIATDAVDVSYAAPLPVNLGADITICAGETLTLDATTPGATYLWNTGATTATIDVSTPGNYDVVVTQSSCTVSDAIDVQVAALPTVNLGADRSACPGDVVSLDATGPGLSYLWNTGATSASITVPGTGTYSVVVTNTAGCTATDVVDVTYATPSAIDLGADIVLCQGNTVVLDATLPGATYAWSNGASSPTITVGASGLYSVDVQQGNCSVSDAVNVTVNPTPSVNLGVDQTLCAGDDVTLDASWPGASYLWNTGVTSATLLVNSTGTYSVDVDLNGCIASDAVDVTVLSATTVDLGADLTLCDGDQVTLDATTPGATYLWSTGATSPTIDVNTSGNYSVQVSTGLCSVSDAVTMTVNPTPSVNLGVDQTLCAGDDVTLDASWPGASYLWNTGATSATLLVNSTGTYSVDVDLNGCIASDAVDVTVLSATTVDLGADLTLCDGEQVTLDATTPGATYLWSTGATSPTIDVNASGNYSVQVSTGLCSVSDAVTVTVNPTPSVNLGVDQTLCAGDDVTLDASWPGATYLWNTGATSATLLVNSTGSYSVDVDLNGCIASDAVDITVLSATTVDLGADRTLCDGDQVTLDATTPGATYFWSTGATSPTIDVNASGNYSVQVSTGLCSVSDAVNVTVNPTPVVDLGGDQVICGGQTSILLDATWTGATYLWNTGAMTPTIDVMGDGNYEVTVDLNGCSASDAITITFGSLTYSLGTDTTLCPSNTLVLGQGLPVGTAIWNDVTNSPTYEVTQGGMYWLHFTGSSGCEVRDTIVVDYSAPGSIDLGADLSICEGESVVLDASLPGATYLWNDGTTSAIRSIALAGTYAVEAHVGACTVSDAITITVIPLPSVDLGADVAVCPAETHVFDATTPGASYLWQDGSTSATFSANSSGMVTVEVTVAGCSASDAAIVTALAAPTLELGADTILCEGASLTLDLGQSGAEYVWDDGSSLPERTMGGAGVYWAEATMNTCTVRDSITVTVFGTSTFDLGTDRNVCAGSSIILDATTPNAVYAWSTGASSPTIPVSVAGTYSVTVTLSGCSVSDVVVVTVIEPMAPDLGPDRWICEGESTTLNVTGAYTSITWTTGISAPAIVVSEPGLYGVEVEDQGCAVHDEIQVNTIPSITTLDLGPDRSLCAGATETVMAPVIPGAEYSWSHGATGPVVDVREAGTYTVTLSGTCINASASLTITLDDCGTYVHVPNAFTPNEDGINDHFLPIVEGPLDRYQLDIFDRWGERIHTTADRNEGWDGTYSGVPSQDGVYVYVLSYRVLGVEGVKSERRTGHVSLLR